MRQSGPLLLSLAARWWQASVSATESVLLAGAWRPGCAGQITEVLSRRVSVKALQDKCSYRAGRSKQCGGACQIEQSGCQLQGSVALLVCCTAAQQDGQAAGQLQRPGCTRRSCLALQTLVGGSCHLQMQTRLGQGHLLATGSWLRSEHHAAGQGARWQWLGCPTAARHQNVVALLWRRASMTVTWPGAGTAAGLSHASKASKDGVVTCFCGGHLTWGRGSIRSRACRAWSCLAAASCEPAVLGTSRAGSLPLRRRCIWWAGSAKTVASHGTAAATTCACPALHRSAASAEHGMQAGLGHMSRGSRCRGCKGAIGSGGLQPEPDPGAHTAASDGRTCKQLCSVWPTQKGRQQHTGVLGIGGTLHLQAYTA